MSYNNSHSVMMSKISEYLTKVCNNAYQQGREDAIDEFAKMLLEDLIPMKDKKFKIAVGTAMPERYTHLKIMDTLDMVIEMIKIKAEQLKEQKDIYEN